MDEQQAGRTVWQGRIGQAPLRVDMLPSGRIFAAWSIRGNERRAVVDTIQQLEQRVLFQLMLGAGPGEDAVARQVLTAVGEGQQGLPHPTPAPPPTKKKKKPGPPGATPVPPPALARTLPARFPRATGMVKNPPEPAGDPAAHPGRYGMKASAPQEGTSVEHVRRQIDPDTRLGTIYAGNRYVFGFAPDYYGIWDEFARDAAVEKFPATDEGRAQAWQRIVELDPAAGEPHQAMIAASRPRLEQARRRKRWPYVVVGLVVVIGAIIVIVVARSGGGGETAGSGGGPVGKTAHIDVSGAQTASEDLTLASFKASGTQAVFGGTVDASWKGPTLELRIQLGSPSTGNLNTTEAGTYRAVTLTITPTGGTPTQIVSSHGECTVTVDTITDSAFVGEIDCGSLPLPGGAGTISASGSFSGGS